MDKTMWHVTLKSKSTSKISKGIAPMTYVVLLSFVLSACTNSNFNAKAGKSKNTATDDSANDSIPQLAISNVKIAAPTGGSNLVTTVFFKATNPSPISTYCSVAQNSVSSLPCSCEYSWIERNETGSNTVQLTRSAKSSVLSVQSSVVTCNAPSVYSTEIENGTEIRVKVLPANGNGSVFDTVGFLYTKGTSNTDDFQDQEGKSFTDIFRYSCFEQNKRGSGVYTAKPIQTNPSDDGGAGAQVPLLMASKFCISKAGADGSGGIGGSGCEGTPPAVVTNQSYYHNLYVRSSERGSINAENTKFKCPLVKETLNANNNSGTYTTYYPLDASFSLALNPSPEYNVGVEAYTKLGIGDGDPTSVESGCGSSSTHIPPGDTNGVLRGCLGFAAKPNSDGSCPKITTPSGIKTTYRLRRYIAMYPPLYEADGKFLLDKSQNLDVIYVLDRPVAYSGPGANPDKPYTMRGPKPCPFSYFDKSGVTYLPTEVDADYVDSTKAPPRYLGTNNSRWDGKNVDGIQFPNYDKTGESCAAVMPLVNADRDIISLGTVFRGSPVAKMKNMYIRPVKAWAPHYEEDTDFLACAPQSTIVKDPPLHFSKNPTTGNVAWCAEAYPSQNSNVTSLDIKRKTDQKYPGKVVPFTSHVVKNSVSSACTATSLADKIGSNYDTTGGGAGVCNGNPAIPRGVALHPSDLSVDVFPQSSFGCSGGNSVGSNCATCSNQTCDRTVVGENTIGSFPLLAPPGDVENALASDSSYECAVTYDNGGSKSKSGLTPTQGCCGNSVKVWTGLSSTSSDANKFNRSAHLEPNTNPTSGTLCGQPAY